MTAIARPSDAGGTTLTVVIPTYDNLAELRRCLEALARQDRAGFRVVVCVDGSTDGTLEYLAALTVRFELLVAQHADHANHGRAATRNLALPLLQGEHVLLLDSDMELDPGALSAHVAILQGRRAASVGAVTYRNARTNPWARFLMTRGMHAHGRDGALRPLDFVTANSCLRADDLIAVGGFDESMSGYGGEDTDLALRLHERGVEFLFNPGARATSVEDKTVQQGLFELRRYAATNLRATRRRHPDAPAPFWIDRLDSPRLRDRVFRAALNPLSDVVADTLLPHSPWPVQRILLNYKVIRTVFQGYREGGP